MSNFTNIEMNENRRQPGVTISWENVAISSKPFLCFGKEDEILRNVYGIVKPGEMVALMGASGSGKTTLLNALTYRTAKNLKVEGEFKINGVTATRERMSMVSSFVQQVDLFFGQMTVKEHLIFHAMLRMGSDFSNKDKLKKVDNLLEELQLKVCKDRKIGIPGIVKGISGGQMRRLSFATEVLTDPAVLYCDEPTSGLDFSMAKSLVKFLRNYSKRGKTIICTIHQPSSGIFTEFDKVCLLAQKRLAYFGSIENAKTHFQGLGIECPEFSNPADVYIENLGVNVDDEQGSVQAIKGYCEVFSKSREFKKIQEEIKELQPNNSHLRDNYTPYKASFFTELRLLYIRGIKNYFRNWRTIILDVTMAILTAVLGGVIYLNSAEIVDGVCYFDQNVATNISTALFYCVTVVCIISVLSAVLAFPLEIPIYLRENYSAVYRCGSYYLSKLLQEIPILIILPLINGSIIYYLARFGCGDKNFALFIFVIILVGQSSYSLGHIISILGGEVSRSISLAAPAIAFQMLFSGFFLKKAETSPEPVKFVKFISVFNYGFDLLMINQWEYVETLRCNLPTTTDFLNATTAITDTILNSTLTSSFESTSVDEYRYVNNVNYRIQPIYCIENGAEILNDQKIRPKNKWFYICMMFALALVFRFIAFVILRFKSKVYKKIKAKKNIS